MAKTNKKRLSLHMAVLRYLDRKKYRLADEALATKRDRVYSNRYLGCEHNNQLRNHMRKVRKSIRTLASRTGSTCTVGQRPYLQIHRRTTFHLRQHGTQPHEKHLPQNECWIKRRAVCQAVRDRKKITEEQRGRSNSLKKSIAPNFHSNTTHNGK